MTARISVCIPIWNDSEWLAGAIETVLGQGYDDWELIIGDNASDEDLEAVTARFNDPRVCYHRWNTHTDLYENFNRTAQLSQYEWVLMLSADDRLVPTCLFKIAERIELAGGLSKLAAVATAFEPVDLEGKPADRAFYGHSRIQAIADGIYDASQWLEVMATNQLAWFFGATAFSREVLIETGWLRPDIGHGADLELMLRACAYGSVAYIHEKLVLYTVRGTSDSPGRMLRNLREDPYTGMGAAWLSALRTHTMVRGSVSNIERRRIRGVVAKSHVQRALQHRLWRGGLGRRGATLEVWRAFTYSPRLMMSPMHLAASFLAIMGPIWVIHWSLQRLTDSRRAVPDGTL